MTETSFLADAKIIIEALADYYQQSISGRPPVINQAPLEKLVAELGLAAHVSTGRLSGETLAEFIDTWRDSTFSLTWVSDGRSDFIHLNPSG